MKRSIDCLSDEDERPSRPRRAKCTNQADGHASSDDRSDHLPSAAAPESDPTYKAEVDLSSSAAYRDMPLVHGDNTNIRVLRILPEKTRGHITCELIVVPVRGQVTYTALSYVWGEVRYSRSIRLNDRSVAVRENLWQFLNQMYQECRTGYFWIDALCINQFDVQERNHQVKMMGRSIPPQSRLLYGWVLNQIFRDTKDYSMPSGSSYWKRTWTVQEFVLAQRIEIRSGPDVLDEHTLRKLYKFDRLPGHLRPKISRSGKDVVAEWDPTAGSFIRLRITRQNHLGPALATGQAARISIAGSKKLTEGAITSSLRNLVIKFAETECGDPRDHVYALLSLVDPEELERGPLSPDYSKPKHELLLDLTRSSLSHWNSSGSRLITASEVKREVSEWARLLGFRNPYAAQRWAIRVVTGGFSSTVKISESLNALS